MCKLAVLIAIRAVFTATQIDCVYPPLRDFLACVESGLLVRYLHARQNFRFILVWFYTTDIFDFVVCDSRLFCRNGVEKNRYSDVCNQKIKTIRNIRVCDDACRAVDNVEIFCQKLGGEFVQNTHRSNADEHIVVNVVDGYVARRRLVYNQTVRYVYTHRKSVLLYHMRIEIRA